MIRTWKIAGLIGVAGLGAIAMLAVVVHSHSSVRPESAGIGISMSPQSAFSATVATSVGGVPSPFDQVAVLGDLDGREDNVADHSLLLADLGGTFSNPAQFVTRVALSEHTIANGFAENIVYYGDSVGNLVVGVGDTTQNGSINNSFTINLPTALNAFGTLDSGSEIVITGLAVNPVADLSSFANVNGSYSSYAGLVGEILYVAFTDTTGGLRLTFNSQIVRSGILAYPIADITSGTTAAPGIISPTGFPVQMGNAFGVAFSVFDNQAGVAVDDDGSIYFQQVDLAGHTAANIVKITQTGTNQDRSAATSGFLTLTTLNPNNGSYGNASGPASQVNHFTNFSGTAPFFGNIAAIAAGPGNVLYAAVARSRNPNDPVVVQNTEGPFQNLAPLGPTPSMVVTMSDAIGGTNPCFSNLPKADGFADANFPNQPIKPGINNFKTFVLGTGPDVRNGSATFGSKSNTQKIDFQVDYTVYSGIAVDEEAKVYLISGGTPAGVGLNPSPGLGEILAFPDDTPFDRKADRIDLRGEVIPNPAVTNTNIGNGKADRFDYIYWEAPVDPVSNTPSGIAGLSRGFLLYLNRTRITTMTSLDSLPNGNTQALNSTVGPIFFDHFDAGHQVAGGDDQSFPFRGDDSDGFSAPSDPAVTGPLLGGYELNFSAKISGTCTSPWNSFFLNSNGNVTFGAGDTSAAPTAASFITGQARVAPAWANLNTESRADSNLNTFPVQALGFANINDFVVRWIDVPETGEETCGSSNSFTMHMYDDGTGVDENATQPLNPANPIGNNVVPFDLQEGPTDLRFSPNGIGASPRPDGSGYLRFRYGRMDLLGSAGSPVLTGYSLTSASVPAKFCNANLGNTPPKELIGDGSQAALFEFFDTGTNTNPAFDLRFAGANPVTSTPKGQQDLNREALVLTGANCSNTGSFSCPK